MGSSDSLGEKKPRKVCLACGREGVSNRCGGCRKVFFCNVACQRAAWIAHRPVCVETAERAARAAMQQAREQQQQQLAAQKQREEEASLCHSDQSHAMGKRDDTKHELQRHARAWSADDSAGDDSAAHDNRHKPRCTERVSEDAEPPCRAKQEDAENIKEQGNVDAADEADNAQATKASKSKKKKHKKKKRSNSVHTPRSAQMSDAPKNRSVSFCVRKHVTWGDVQAREFTRFPGGGGAVPYDGTWALGLGRPISDVQLGTVLEVDEWRQEELKARTKELSKSKRSQVREGETRQFDYRRGASNPLFSRLTERERKELFIANEKKKQESLQDAPITRGRAHSSASTTSCGSDDDDIDHQDFACVSIEQLDEFAKIRDSRDGACGCSCGDLLKKVSKMNVKRLHAFLADRNVVVKSHSKPEVMAMAKAIALREQNCTNSKDCECLRNGIGCHLNACVGCAGDCHNPLPVYKYNKDTVVKYRRELLSKWRDAEKSDAKQQQQQPICVS
ncbi:TPA: hypothetical protein N0F65_000508 [Lagenidium giganteum]|uniref:MYND-type domain-containing protein n=1 Tax=Lagenidium giganteum TaxID=4803 RepID=A0AAV2Z0G4_9STRA|nr:TPA: hypothetical protein N0F65_000508 [Lagenidium giganteum]